ncbi:MAG: nickel insertion protein, partial [Candidatus Hinthialibacter sp.]
ILQHSTSIGVRMHTCERRTLQRKSCEVQTPWGVVRGKICWGHGVEERFTPEYEDCRRIHLETQTPLAQIYEETQRAFGRQSNL